VRAVARAPEADTCAYFEPANHAEARAIIRDRQRDVWRRFWGGWRPGRSESG
jgi:hypothetical protein